MYTQCPACSTYFRITPEQLQAAGGKVRCGECRHVFHAPDFLTDTLPGAPAEEPFHDEPDYEQLLREPKPEPKPEPEPEPIVAEETYAAEPAPAAEEIAPHITADSTVEKAEDDLAIDLDELFGNETADYDSVSTAEPVPEPEPEPAPQQEPEPPEAAAPPGSATYGEEDIEALLKFGPQGGSADDVAQTFELPWDEPPAEATPPAALGNAAGTLTDFDLPESTLTTAQRVSPTPALSPISALLVEEDTAPRRSLLGTLAWTLASLLLLAVLAVQYVYLNRVALVHHAELRPLLELLCEHTGCRLPPRRDVTALTLLERDIRSHDRYQGALTIHATVQNRAAFAQPYPAVDVVMRDLTGRVVAARRFLPQDYLSGAAAPPLLAPQATAQLTLDVVDPGAEAVGFEFTFH